MLEMYRRKVSIGIDLGTSKCCVGVVRDGKVVILENERGMKTTPSYVAFTDTERLVGDVAEDQAAVNPINTINGIKRIIGRDFEDPLVTEYCKNVPYPVIASKNGICVRASYKGQKELLYPQQVTASLLLKMKRLVEATFQCTVEQAVISVPASFENSQRLATKEAATIAGLEVLALLNEPTAAALAYHQARTKEGREVIAIIDFGGGKLDVSIVAVGKGKVEVLAVSGSQEIGGEFLDDLIMNRVIEAIKVKYGEGFILNRNSLAKLRLVCAKAKKNLSLLPKSSICIDCVNGHEDFLVDISREEFQSIITPKLHPVLIRCLDKAFLASGLNKREVYIALLVGGSSRIPLFKAWLKNYFDPTPIALTINLNEAIASGAALLAAMLGGGNAIPDVSIKDILTNTFCLSHKTNPNLQYIFSPPHVTIPGDRVMPYGGQSPFNEETKCQTFELFEEISDPKIHHKLIGTLCLSEEFSKASSLVKDITFTVDRCSIFDVAVSLEASPVAFSNVAKNYAGKLKNDELARVVHREELFQRDEQEELSRVKTHAAFEKRCFEIVSEVENSSYRDHFPELVESLTVYAAEGIVWSEDTSVSTVEVHHRREPLEALYEEFITKIEKLKNENLTRTAAVEELTSLCSNIDALFLTDEVWSKDTKSSIEMRSEVERITRWLKLTETPTRIDCDKERNALQNLFERSVGRLVDNQQIINLRNYCLDLRETLPNNVEYEHSLRQRESLIGEVEDCLGLLDDTKRAYRAECAKRMSSLKKLHRELVEHEGSNSEAHGQNVGNPALLLRKICLLTRDLVKKCLKTGSMDLQKVEHTKKQIVDFLRLVDGEGKASNEEWNEKISEILVSKVMFESTLKKQEQMRLNEEQRRVILQEIQKSISSIQGKMVTVGNRKLFRQVMQVADKLLGWLQTPNTFSMDEYEKKVEQWRTLTERVNAKMELQANKDLAANSAKVTLSR